MAESLAHFKSPEARAEFLAIYESLLKLWPVHYEEQYLSTRFGKTHMLVTGPEEAPPLLLLHGLKATAAMWQPNIAELSRHYRCYSVQTIDDVGKSVQTRPIRSVADYMAWLKELLDELKIDQVRVAGFSYGGFLAANLALHAPERVSRLILLSPLGTLAPLTPWFFVRAIFAFTLKSPFLARCFWSWFIYNKELLNFPATDLFLAGWQHFEQPKEMVVPTAFSDEMLRQITVPTTVLIGENEVIYRHGPMAAAKRAELIPTVQVQLIPEAAHALNLDNPAAVSACMLEGLT